MGRLPWPEDRNRLRYSHSGSDASNGQDPARGESNRYTVTSAVIAAVLYCCTRCPGVRIMVLTCGATETRTPDLLHAMERRIVHRSPRPFTRDPPELAFRPEQVTSVHQSSPRTVTSLVTSPPPPLPPPAASQQHSKSSSSCWIAPSPANGPCQVPACGHARSRADA